MAVNIEMFLPLIEEEVKGYKVPVVDLIAVHTRDPFKVLVATILSARTKDEVTAVAADRLFARADNVHDLAGIPENEIQKIIYPVGFYKNKAKYLAALPAVLKNDFGGEVPAAMESLLTLPGVGRKTANLVLAQAFHIPAICVDTHVHRIMNIWGYVKTDTPLQTETALRARLPEKYWLSVNSLLVAFGQGKCRPIAPHCDDCLLAKVCPKIGVVPRKIKSMREREQLLRLVSWNVNGLRSVHKKGFLESMMDMAPDVIGLQEIKARKEQLPRELQEVDGYHSYFFSGERKGYSGVAVYSRVKPEGVIEGLGVQRFDAEGRVLTLEFETFYFVNCYFPNAKGDLSRLDFKHDFNVMLQNFAEELALSKTVVVCGDFNVAHKEIDLANPRQNENSAGFTREERSWMDDFTRAGWIDSFRKKNKSPDQYSWWSYRSRARDRNIGWRIDYHCVDKRSGHRIVDVEIRHNIFGSDHCPVVLDLRR